ncbi:hypothetical protein M1M27_gp14 [Cellulophaga phage Ingeline_1]|uniref:Uncharacterized protein n=1 Tax=Cellulophaga phage Ingeline_1 TaxID=2745674 RepID=A0A8E4ZIF7_9CAUD|nr:hypothetical protein M1M27_gp14 [Cellulophaga phage Ingeline_1]QQV90025.1 hypothetical protein Ingeline2_37 [Cellulophaga phage Ingeline_2]QQV90075.1 hypothetical protein Ingeline3_37 [Cellulophaga phage Ingeline_3]QQV90125.1 hypothetical protein Ingeline4_37 [Cellulophaga phage Ingeline_4]QQV90174.1 hypothetical protein Ingeline5_36 [Cellulophaga phage Ingeline_5]QQV90224.1 hypothetical protein Ingeline6_37 [Cellulophaga phage Ingeline_6]QQV90274.1 hypothetical protein Ingeline7_37 [Cellu
MAIALYVIATPFFFYSYRLFPEDLTQISFLGLTIKAGLHGNLNYFAYYLFTKLVILILIIIWYVTNAFWWKQTLLVPISMLLFQIIAVINTSVNYIDEIDFWFSLPIIIAVLLPIIYTSKKLSFYTSSLDLKDEIETEINSITNQ